MSWRLVATVLMAVLAGCSATDAPPSMSPEGAAPAATVGNPALSSVPAWLAAAPLDPTLVCYLDLVEGARADKDGWHTKAGDAVRLAGWMVEPATKNQRAAMVRLRPLSAAGPEAYFGAERSERADVSASTQFASSPPVNAGLTAGMLLDGVAPGKYEIIYVVGDAQGAGACTLGPSRALVVQ